MIAALPFSPLRFPAVLALLILSGCGIGSKRVQSGDYPFDFRINCPVDGRHVIIFLIDGCRPDALYRMAAQGDLPNIKKYFIDRGIVADPALSPVPSITSASVAAITCGSYPGHCNILGNRWFDPIILNEVACYSLGEYYSPNHYSHRKTIYEMLPDEMTVAVTTRSSQGSAYNIPMYYQIAGLIDVSYRNWAAVNRVFVHEFMDVVDCANREGVFPALTFFHLPGVDEVSHHAGSFSEKAKRVLRNDDDAIGELLSGLRKNGVLDRICLILVADHGQVPVGKRNHLHLERLFEIEFDLPLLDCHGKLHPDIPRKGRGLYYNHFAAIASNNGRNAIIHMRYNPCRSWVSPRKMEPWEMRPPWTKIRNYPTPHGRIDIIDALRKIDGIGFVIGRPNAGEVAIFSNSGESRIRTKMAKGEEQYAYEVSEGTDPLGYAYEPAARRLMDGGYHSSRDWLHATAYSHQSDVVAQLPSFFQSPSCGDLFVVAADGWDFGKRNVSSHGGFLNGEMHVPLLIAGPGIRHGWIGPVRVVDIAPTILEYLGHGDRIKESRMDGRSFWEEIREKP